MKKAHIINDMHSVKEIVELHRWKRAFPLADFSPALNKPSKYDEKLAKDYRLDQLSDHNWMVGHPQRRMSALHGQLVDLQFPILVQRTLPFVLYLNQEIILLLLHQLDNVLQ